MCWHTSASASQHFQKQGKMHASMHGHSVKWSDMLLEEDSSGQSLTGLGAGELLGEQLCLGRLRGGEYCLPWKELVPRLLPLL